MKCPTCKKYELLLARSRENSPAIDGLKCPNCDIMYHFNESHHLVADTAGVAHKLEDKDLQPGISREGFMNVLKEVTRPIEKVIPEPKKRETALRQTRHLTSERKYHRLTEPERAQLRKRLLANERVPDLARYFKLNVSYVYICKQKLKKELLTKGVAQGAHPVDIESLKPPKQNFALVIRMASNGGFVVTDVENDVYVYTKLEELIKCVRDWALKP